MDSEIIELRDEFIKRKWEVQTEVPIKYKGVFDYKIPLIVKQKQLEYKIFHIPLNADSDVRDAVVDIARQYKNTEILILAMLHPKVAKYISEWVRSRVVLTTRELWEVIAYDVKLHKYQREIEDMKNNIRKINAKIRILEHEVGSRF